MMYYFVGTDREATRREAAALRDALRKKKPDATVVRFGEAAPNLAEFEAHIGGQGLFNAASIIYADGILESAEARELIGRRAADIAASPNVFIFIERRLDAATAKKVEPRAAKIVRRDVSEGRPFMFAGGASVSTREFNPFAIGDAVAARDKATLFSLMAEAAQRDVPPEEVSGMVFATVRSMLAAAGAATPEEADMKPFPFKKAKAGLAKWKVEELRTLAGEVTRLYHDAHRGKRDLALGLERLALTRI